MDKPASQPESPVLPMASVEASAGAAASTGAATSRVAGASRADDDDHSQQLELLLSLAPDVSEEARARALDAARAAQRLPTYNGLDRMQGDLREPLSLIEHAAALLFDPKEVDRLLRIARGPSNTKPATSHNVGASKDGQPRCMKTKVNGDFGAELAYAASVSLPDDPDD